MPTTIAAISTPYGVGGIAVIRLSGGAAAEIAARCFKPLGGYPLGERQVSVGRIFRGDALIDEGVATVFRAPHSYTGEDVVEISCHGGLAAQAAVLRAVIEAGAAPAAAGEFTKRAFLNGKLDLIEAEAVGALIAAEGEAALRAASAQREGALGREVAAIADRLTDLVAGLLAAIDFPDDLVEESDMAEAEAGAAAVAADLRRLEASYRTAQLIQNGVYTAIVGRANAGKSSLLNRLSGIDRSIVTDIPGTTRDVVEATVERGGVLLRLADTAGLRDSGDPVEREGQARTARAIDRAELILCLFDGSQPLSADDRALTARVAGRKGIAVLTKSDLPAVLRAEDLAEEDFFEVVALSARTGEGIDALFEAIGRRIGVGDIDPSAAMVLSERQFALVAAARGEADAALEALAAGQPPDIAASLLEAAIDRLLELTGCRATDAVVDRIFQNFCVGK